MWNKIIFVCKSGTCRAPMAAALLRECSLRREPLIEAKGLIVLFPEPLNQKTEAVLISNGISMDGYMASQLEASDVDDETLVLVMEEQHIAQVCAIIGEERRAQVQVLTAVVGEELEIMDPYGAPLPSYGLCFESLAKTIKKFAVWLNEQEERADE